MVTSEHEDFGRAVVALARAHNMTGLRLQFRKSFTRMGATGPFEEVSLQWSEGRHGEAAPIHFETRGSHQIPEAAIPSPPVKT